MARFYCLTPLERRVAEALVDKARPTVVDQYRFNAGQMLEALNGSGAGVSEEEVGEILGRLVAAGIIMLQAETPHIYSLVERERDFTIKAVLDNGVNIKAPRETTMVHRVEAEVLDTILQHEHLDAASLERVIEPLTASGADGVRPLSAFVTWLNKHFLINRSGEEEIGTFSPHFPPLWCTSAPWVARLGVRDEGVTVDRLFRLDPAALEILFPLVSEMRSSGKALNVSVWCTQLYGAGEGKSHYGRLIGALRPLFTVQSDWSGWRLSPEFSRYRFVVMEPFGVRFKSHVEDLSESYTAHPDHAYWQLAVLAGKATGVQAEREMGTETALPSADAPAPPDPASEPEPSPAPPEPAPAVPVAVAPVVVTEAVRQDADASWTRVRVRVGASDSQIAKWHAARDFHRKGLDTLRAEVQELRANLTRKEAALGTLESAPPTPPPDIDQLIFEAQEAVRRHNAAFGDVLLLDDTGVHVVLPIPVATPPATTSPPSSPPSSEPPAASPAPRSGNGITEWDEATKDALVERVLVAGVDKRTEMVDAFIAEHPSFNAMSVRAVVSRMAGGFEETFCKSYVKGRTGKDRTHAIQRLATFYRKSPADITRLVGPAH